MITSSLADLSLESILDANANMLQQLKCVSGTVFGNTSNE